MQPRLSRCPRCLQMVLSNTKNEILSTIFKSVLWELRDKWRAIGSEQKLQEEPGAVAVGLEESSGAASDGRRAEELFCVHTAGAELSVINQALLPG